MSYEIALERIEQEEKRNTKTLDLSKLDLTEIPAEIGRLFNLERLDLSNNQITEIKGLENLTHLKILFFDNNQITKIKGLEKLVNLTDLGFANNQISVINSLNKLLSLNWLSFVGNRISEIEGLNTLTNLKWLFLRENQITEIKGLETLKELGKLDLCNNKITYLTFATLDLGIPIKWESISAEVDKGLFIKDNPLHSPPPEIVQQGNDAIRRYFEELTKNRLTEAIEKQLKKSKENSKLIKKLKKKYEIEKNRCEKLEEKLEEERKESYHYEAKLLIIGESGAGKTTLAKKIKEGIQTAMPTDADTTRGIDVSTFPFTFQSSQSNENQEFKMNIWDFGGQEIYHSTHQFFLSQRALYVLVTDGRKQNTHLNYWCQVVELLGENSPMLIVENQKQGHTLTAMNFDAYKSRFDFICTPFLRSNFLTTEGLPQVIEEIKHRIQSLPGIGTVLPRTWFNIRAQIEEEAQKKDYISEDEYVKICEAEGLNDIDALHLSKDYLHPVGVLLHFQDNPVLRNYVILKNAWATDAVYAVLRSDKIVKETQGHFTYQDAEAIWSDAKYRRRVDFLLELMKKFELCYQLENTQKYIAPQLLPSSAPTYTLPKGKKASIIYEYDFLPKGLLNRLTVRLHEHIADHHWVWQQGVVLQLEDNQAEVIESYDNKKIEINAVGEEPKEILTEIVKALDKLNRTFEKIRVDKKVPCNCSTCSRSQTPYFFSYDSLIRRHRKNKPTIECDISYQDVKVLDLLFGILNEVPEINSKKIFFSYSKHDKDLRDELEKHLASLKRQQKVETWHDRDMYAGDEWHPTIIEKLESADIILLLVSANFLATDYTMNEEVPRALERAASEKCIVIPIIVKPCIWENEPFAKSLALPDKGKAVTQYDNRDEAWTLVAKGIDAIVKR